MRMTDNPWVWGLKLSREDQAREARRGHEHRVGRGSGVAEHPWLWGGEDIDNKAEKHQHSWGARGSRVCEGAPKNPRGNQTARQACREGRVTRAHWNQEVK